MYLHLTGCNRYPAGQSHCPQVHTAFGIQKHLEIEVAKWTKAPYIQSSPHLVIIWQKTPTRDKQIHSSQCFTVNGQLGVRKICLRAKLLEPRKKTASACGQGWIKTFVKTHFLLCIYSMYEGCVCVCVGVHAFIYFFSALKQMVPCAERKLC